MHPRLNIYAGRASGAALVLTLAACGGGGGGATVGGSTSTPSPSATLVATVASPVYAGTYAAEKVAVFNLLNDFRSRCGFGKVAQNARLDAAAQSHADYLAKNPSFFAHNEIAGKDGYTGVTPADRWQYAGYSYSAGTEITAMLTWGAGTAGNTTNNLVDINELQATAHLKSLLVLPYHLLGALTPDREVGIGLANLQNATNATFNYKPLNIDFATPSGQARQSIASTDVATFPCNGITGLQPIFGAESPDPFPDANRDLTPYGHPILVAGAVGTTVALTSGTITERGGAALPTRMLTQGNDPHAYLSSHVVMLVPTQRLADNSTYDVTLTGTNSGMVSSSNPTGTWSRSFSFSSGTHNGE